MMKKTVFLLVAVLMLAVVLGCGQVQAAEIDTEDKAYVTFDELNDDDVFIKQSRRGTCTLASSAMIMRRAAMLAGDENWADITESSVGGVAWSEGVGISWKFTYQDVTMVHDYVSSTDDLKKLLEEHPEGIVAYDTYMPHAIALTDYDEEEGVFYCSDPSEACPGGRVPVSDALIDIEDVSVVWYVSSPTDLSIAEEEDILEITEHPISTLDKTDFMTKDDNE